MKKRVSKLALALSLAASVCGCGMVEISREAYQNNDEPTEYIDTSVTSTAKPLSITPSPDTAAEGSVPNGSTSEKDVTLVIDNTEFASKDENGNELKARIIDGTVYIPVESMAEAMGKSYYWDGTANTAYIGDMSGGLEYPSLLLADADILGAPYSMAKDLTDNYGNTYSNALIIAPNGIGTHEIEILLGMQYSRFKCTIYTPKGCNDDTTTIINIKADGKIIYTSPELSKISQPIDVDLRCV